MFMRTATRTVLALSALSACVFASACSDSDSDGDDNNSTPTESAQRAATVVDNGAEPAYVGAMFTGSASGSASGSVGDVIAAVQANLSLLFTLPSCTVISNVVIDTDGPSSLDVAFDNCTGPNGNVILDGALHADLQVTDNPTTLEYSLETDGLTIGDRTIAGSWAVHAVLGEGRSSWTGDLTVTGPNGTVTSSTDANFRVEGLCVTYALDAQVADDDNNNLRVHATEVTRCLGECPTAGSVTVTGRSEGTLAWNYNGQNVVTATGSTAGSFELDLGCQ